MNQQTKNKLLLTTISVFSLLVFAGCGNLPQSNLPQSNQANQPASISIKQSTQATSATNSNLGAPDPTFSAADIAAYTSAVQLKDETYCAKITNQSYQQQCLTAISDGKTAQEALAKSDASLCSKLSSTDSQQACQIYIQADLQTKAAAKAAEDQIKKDDTLRDQIILSGDYTRCQEIKTEGDRHSCEVNILTEKALQAKNISWCDKASQQEMRDVCRMQYDKLSAANQ